MKLKTLITDPSSRKDRIIFLAVLLFLSGCIGGILSSSVSENKDNFRSIFLSGGLSIGFGTSTVIEILKSNFSGTVFSVFIVMIAGFFAFGQIISVPIICYRGFCFGSAIYLCMNDFGNSGIIASLAVIIPYGLYSAVIILMASRESVKSSNIILSFMFLGREKEEIKKYVKLYFLKFIFLFIFTLVGIVAQTLFLYITVRFIL